MRTLELGATSASTAHRLAGRGIDARVSAEDRSILTRFSLPAYCFDPLGEWPDEQFELIYSVGLLQRYEDAQVVRILEECARRSSLVVHLQPNALCKAYREWRQRSEAAGTWRFGTEHARRSLECLYSAANIETLAEYSIGRNFPADDGEHYLLVSIGRSLRGRRPSVSIIQRFWKDDDYLALTAAATLEEAERLERLGHPVQVIFIDDGESLNRSSALSSMLQSRRNAVWIRNREAKGASASYNQALATVTSDYVILLDGCVGMLRGTERMLEYLTGHQEALCLGVALRPNDEPAQRIRTALPEEWRVERFNPSEGRYSEAALREALPALYALFPTWPIRRLGFKFEENHALAGPTTVWQPALLLSELVVTLGAELHLIQDADPFCQLRSRAAEVPPGAEERHADYYYLRNFNITTPSRD